MEGQLVGRQEGGRLTSGRTLPRQYTIDQILGNIPREPQETRKCCRNRACCDQMGRLHLDQHKKTYFWFSIAIVRFPGELID
jgi:hypothetical protein